VPPAYEIITADDLERALDLAKAWTLVTRGGRIEVPELTTETFTPPAPTVHWQRKRTQGDRGAFATSDNPRMMTGTVPNASAGAVIDQFRDG
jgi:hypothetical protein